MRDPRRRVPFESKQELRAGKNALNRGLDTCFKPAGAPAGFKEAHDALHVRIGHRLSIRTAGQIPDDVTSALCFGGRVRGPACEDPTPARSVSRTGHFKGTRDRERL